MPEASTDQTMVQTIGADFRTTEWQQLKPPLLFSESEELIDEHSSSTRFIMHSRRICRLILKH